MEGKYLPYKLIGDVAYQFDLRCIVLLKVALMV